MILLTKGHLIKDIHKQGALKCWDKFNLLGSEENILVGLDKIFKEW